METDLSFDHYIATSAVITQGAAGQSEIVAGVEGKKIRVVGYTVVMDAAGTFRFQSANTDKTGAMPVNTNGGVSSNNVTFFCEKGEALNITSTVGKVFGHVSYQLIPA